MKTDFRLAALALALACVPSALAAGPDGRLEGFDTRVGAIDGLSRCYRALDRACPGYVAQHPSGNGMVTHAFGMRESMDTRVGNGYAWTKLREGNTHDGDGKPLKVHNTPVSAHGSMVMGEDVLHRKGVFIFTESSNPSSLDTETSYFCPLPKHVEQSGSAAPLNLRFQAEQGPDPALYEKTHSPAPPAVDHSQDMAFYATYAPKEKVLHGQSIASATMPEQVVCHLYSPVERAPLVAIQDEVTRFYGGFQQCVNDRMKALESKENYADWWIAHVKMAEANRNHQRYDRDVMLKEDPDYWNRFSLQSARDKAFTDFRAANGACRAFVANRTSQGSPIADIAGLIDQADAAVSRAENPAAATDSARLPASSGTANTP